MSVLTVLLKAKHSMLILSINKLPAHTAKYLMYLKLSDYIKTTITSVELYHKPKLCVSSSCA